MFQNQPIRRVALVEGSGSSAIPLQGSGGSFECLRVVPGTLTTTKGLTGDRLDSCTGSTGPLVLGKETMRSKWKSPGGLFHFGGGLTMDTPRVCKGLGVPSEVFQTATDVPSTH